MKAPTQFLTNEKGEKIAVVSRSNKRSLKFAAIESELPRSHSESGKERTRSSSLHRA